MYVKNFKNHMFKRHPNEYSVCFNENMIFSSSTNNLY